MTTNNQIPHSRTQNSHMFSSATHTAREMEGIQHKTISVKGLNMHIAEIGQGPLVLLLHGFPDLWYTWRHQIIHLAANGYRAVAPDLRGYGDTTGAPADDHTKFTVHHIVGDLVALIDSIKDDIEDKVFVVGHDWGAIIAWKLCMYRPDKVRALANMSVPFMRRHPEVKTVELFRRLCGDDHYICRLQVPGEVEGRVALMGTRTTFLKSLTHRHVTTPSPSSKGDGVAQMLGAPVELPPWISEEDVEYYVSKFEKTGFTGPANYYRAWDLSWELDAPWQEAKVEVPTKFMVGDLDLVYHFPGFKEYIHNGEFHKDVPLLEEIVVLEGVAHFLHQEKPDDINKNILDFFNKF